MSVWDNIKSFVRSKIIGFMEGAVSEDYKVRSDSIAERRQYRLGSQRRFLKRSKEGYDDNIISNFLRLALDRSISLLFGKTVKFEYEDDAVQEFIDGVYEDNNKPILLHRMALTGGEDGTVFVKIVPDAVKGFRLIVQDPLFKDVLVDPDDFERVVEYITQYKTKVNRQEVAKKETISAGNYTIVTDQEGNDHVMEGSPEEVSPNWIIRNYISSRDTGGKWALQTEKIWDYPEPPIVHWQNLPTIGDAWGEPDLPDDVIELQDNYNFNNSNINRIIRFFAHPFRWSRHFSSKSEMDDGPASMPNANSDTAEIYQLPPVGDIPGASQHAQSLRQAIFDITRNTDISSMKDKVGALTNFGLRILFFDALNKLETKRNLYGWGLREINRRMLMFSGQEPQDCKVIWEDPLPVDETALRTNLQSDLGMGVVSKATAASRLGYDYEVEKKLIDEETQQANQNNNNIGAAIIRSFSRGEGVTGGSQLGKQPIEKPGVLAR